MGTPPEPPPDELRGVEPLGRGYTADVYPWGDGRVLKLFHREEGRHGAEREYRNTRAVHAAGLPAPAAHELVEIDGRWGIVLERVDGVSMLDRVRAKPWTLFAAVRELAELHVRVHRCPAPAELPSLRDWVAGAIDAAPGLSPAEREAGRARLAGLPDGAALCHGDFHPGNVLYTARGPVIIDWSSTTRGHPLADVAYTSRLMRTADLPPWAPRYMHLLLRCTRTLIHRSYLGWCLRLHGATRREVEAWDGPLAAVFAARAWRLPAEPRAAAPP